MTSIEMPTRALVHAAAALALAFASPYVGSAATDVRLEPAGESMRLDSRPEWELKRDEDGIRSYEKKQAGSPLLSFKAEGVIDAPIDLVVSVLLDAERSEEWISYLSESVVLRWIEEPRDFVQFSRFDIPWPVKDRMFVSRVALDVDPETFEAEPRVETMRTNGKEACPDAEPLAHTTGLSKKASRIRLTPRRPPVTK